MNDGSHRAGVACLEMDLDGTDVYYHNMAHLSARECKQINNHLAYDHYVRTGSRFQKCWVDDGNELLKFRTKDRLGRLSITDNKRHLLTVHITDAHGNSSVLTLHLQGTPPEEIGPARINGPLKLTYRTEENALVVSVKNCPATENALTLYVNGKPHCQAPAYRTGNETVFIHDFRNGLPDSLEVAGKRKVCYFQRVISGPEGAELLNGNLSLQFGPSTLFDTLYMEVKEDPDDQVVAVHNPLTPLQSPLKISMKPFAGLAHTDKTAAYLDLNSGNRLKYLGGQWDQENNIHFSTKVLGRFTLASDNTPPIIRPRIVNRRDARFQIYDNRSGIGSWWATLNGKFLLMGYEHKQNTLFSIKQYPDQVLTGTLELTVTDNQGNTAVYRKEL